MITNDYYTGIVWLVAQYKTYVKLIEISLVGQEHLVFVFYLYV